MAGAPFFDDWLNPQWWLDDKDTCFEFTRLINQLPPSPAIYRTRALERMEGIAIAVARDGYQGSYKRSFEYGLKPLPWIEVDYQSLSSMQAPVKGNPSLLSSFFWEPGYGWPIYDGPEPYALVAEFDGHSLINVWHDVGDDVETDEDDELLLFWSNGEGWAIPGPFDPYTPIERPPEEPPEE